MNRIIVLTVLLAFASIANAQNQTIGLNHSLGFNQANDKFNFNGNTIGNYSLGWYTTPSSAEMIFSAYGGFNLFTNATHRFRIAGNGNVGIGTQNPRAFLDVGRFIPNGTLGTVLGRLQEGDNTLDGTYLGVKGHATQGTNAPFVKSFSIVHNFYGRTNSSINFFRGGSTIGGLITFNTDDDNEKMRITNTGNVGIGTTNPTAKLEIAGNELENPSILVRNRSYRSTDSQGTTSIQFAFENHRGPKIEAAKITNNTTSLNFYTEYGYNISQHGMIIRPGAAGSFVGIGTKNPTERLHVNGTVLASEVKVSISASNVPDYVFQQDYQLPSLEEVETYIKANSHLPEIPSANQLEESGLELARMNMLLLQKIEELTLYLIEQNKELKNQNEQIKIQNEQINELKAILGLK